MDPECLPWRGSPEDTRIIVGLLMQWLKLPAWKVGDREFKPHSGLQVSKKRNFSSCSFVKVQYCGEPPWPRGSVLSLRSTQLEFRILCLEGTGIACILPSSAGYPSIAQFSLYVHKSGLKRHSFNFIFWASVALMGQCNPVIWISIPIANNK